jgi:probable HAF family extracellular repeat protein
MKGFIMQMPMTSTPLIRNTLPIRLLLLLVTLFVSYGAFAQIPLDQRQYHIVKLQGNGGTSSAGSGINNRGWITGFSNDAGDATMQAVIWDRDSIKPLGTLGGPNSGVIFPVKNNRGIVAGIAETGNKNPLNEEWSCSAFFPTATLNICVGFAWENGVMRALAVFPGGYNGFASGANNQGQIVGWAENGIHDPTCTDTQVLQFRAALWGPAADEMRELPPLTALGDSTSAATAINDRGQAVGISGICGFAVGAFSAAHMVIWEDGKATEIPNLGGIAWNTPTAINEQGVVVGFANASKDDGGSFNEQPFIWTRDAGTHKIDPLPGDIRGQALGINSRGQVVGLSRRPGFRRAFIYESGIIKDLNDMVEPGYSDHLRFANDINDKGEITGQAVSTTTGEFYTFLAMPILKDD